MLTLYVWSAATSALASRLAAIIRGKAVAVRRAALPAVMAAPARLPLIRTSSTHCFHCGPAIARNARMTPLMAESFHSGHWLHRRQAREGAGVPAPASGCSADGIRESQGH